MTLPFVLSARAEAACHLLNQTLGLHRLQTRALRDAERRSRLAAPPFDDAQVQRQAAVLRMMSITEAFCADRLLELAETEIEPTTNSVRSIVWDRAAGTTVATWEGIRAGYKDWFQIKPKWSSFDPLIEVRNAIAHGLGWLTRIQKKNPQSVTGKLALAGITLDEDRVLLNETDIAQIRDACIELIAEIDELAQGRSTQ